MQRQSVFSIRKVYNEGKRKVLNIYPVNEKIDYHKEKWLILLNGMGSTGIETDKQEQRQKKGNKERK
jgi:hypothetical protein